MTARRAQLALALAVRADGTVGSVSQWLARPSDAPAWAPRPGLHAGEATAVGNALGVAITHACVARGPAGHAGALLHSAGVSLALQLPAHHPGRTALARLRTGWHAPMVGRRAAD